MRAAATALALLALLGACADDVPAPAPTLAVDVVSTAEPRGVAAAETQLGLTQLDASGNVVPGLAVSWRVTDDGRSVIFRLRDAAWDDGRPVTAGDVVTVLRRALARDSRNPLRAGLAGIENAPAVAAGRLPPSRLGIDDPLPNVIEIRLAAPEPALLSLLARPELAIVRSGRFPPALGPFRLVTRGSEPVFRLERNERFHDAGSVVPGAVELRVEPDAGAAIDRFRTGAAQVVTGSTVAGFGAARVAAPRDALRVEPAPVTVGLAVNLRRQPFADIRVRRALSLAIDRDGLVARRVAATAAAAALTLTPAGRDDPEAYRPDWTALPLVARQLEAARLLAESGYDAARPLTVTVAVPASRDHAALLAALAEDWGAVGVRTVAVTREPRAHDRAVARSDFDLAFVEAELIAGSRLLLLSGWRCVGNPSGYCSREVNRLLDAAPLEPDLATREALLRRAEGLIVEDAPFIPLLRPVRWSLVNPRIAGWVDNAAGSHPLARLDLLPDPTRR